MQQKWLKIYSVVLWMYLAGYPFPTLLLLLCHVIL